MELAPRLKQRRPRTPLTPAAAATSSSSKLLQPAAHIVMRSSSGARSAGGGRRARIALRYTAVHILFAIRWPLLNHLL